MPEKRDVVPVSIPSGLVKEIDELVERGMFSSRSDAIRFGARMVVVLERRLHERSEDYAYDEIIAGFKRGGKHVSRH